ncbi:CotH kinase family protein [Micropruina sonneratiae]|uniref:CotH kinase family protein n=1 Tax=Micropruina sonneratiae TaxID=2986940 RepID=UPI002226E135|nr:CotH kinase family protein [Micropruina sp. KQZ13P-5]MCW3158289.1 CotH kinase family protein [Micropruina sp. KQZ13P-5]
MPPISRRSLLTGLGATAVLVGAAACTAQPAAAPSADPAAGTVLEESAVHTIAVTVDAAAFTDMLQTYVDSGDKEWIKADVTIDDQSFSGVGIKLKGNSSLRGVTTDTAAETLPLRIRLDKYVDDQLMDGYGDFTVRSNSSATALNEAVALDLLEVAGLASEKAIFTRYSVNGSAEVFRLTVQNLDDVWVGENFPDAGDDSVLYKAESEGDWSWRGDDGDYSSSFDIEAGKDGYQPLIGLLDLLNNGTSSELAKQLPSLLDLDAFATYLAFQEAVDNFDDIDGPGNNSYLFWDSGDEQFTVVAWDHNLAFGVSNRGGGGGGGGDQPGGGRPTGTRPNGGGNGGGPGGRARTNPLVTAFKANTDWSKTYDQQLSALTTSFTSGGALVTALDARISTLKAGASDLVDADTLTSEGDAIRAYAG